jgi:DNA-binding IclR family transcriptional regulator
MKNKDKNSKASPELRGRSSAVAKPVGATLSTLQILQFAVEQVRPWTATEAARALSLNPSTCFNIVRTLVASGYFELVAEAKRYRVGAAFLSLARRLTTQSKDFGTVRPSMQAVADRYKLTVTLWKRCAPVRMELVVVATCNTSVNIQMPVGQRLPVLVGGMGRIMALSGGLSEELRRQVFGEIKWQRPLTYSAFLAQARLAEQTGWGVDEGYMHRSVTAVAVPVRIGGREESIEYVCSATMFRHQYASVVLRDIAKALAPVAAAVAAVLQATT